MYKSTNMISYHSNKHIRTPQMPQLLQKCSYLFAWHECESTENQLQQAETDYIREMEISRIWTRWPEWGSWIMEIWIHHFTWVGKRGSYLTAEGMQRERERERGEEREREREREERERRERERHEKRERERRETTDQTDSQTQTEDRQKRERDERERERAERERRERERERDWERERERERERLRAERGERETEREEREIERTEREREERERERALWSGLCCSLTHCLQFTVKLQHRNKQKWNSLWAFFVADLASSGNTVIDCIYLIKKYSTLQIDI